MESTKKLFLFVCLFLIAYQISYAQQVISGDNASYMIEGQYNFIIAKTDLTSTSNRLVYKVETKIPDKSQKQMYYPGSNHSFFDLVGDNMVIVYDIWQKSNETKDCYIKVMNAKTGKFSEPKLLFSTKLNSVYSSSEIIYQRYYSPDKTKLAIFKDNISPTYTIEPELVIYDSKTFNVLSTKKISGKYQSQKRVFDLSSVSMTNEGDITLRFSLLNEKTKVTTKTFSADISFNDTELKNIKDLGSVSSDGGTSQTSHGLFYKTLEDYVNDRPIKGVRLKNGSFSWSVFGGTDFKLIDDQGNIQREDAKDMPGDFFTYKSSDGAEPYVMRLVDKKPYIILAAGKLSYYALYSEQNLRFFSEGWEGELQKFKERKFEEYLEQYGLLADYKKDKPRRDFGDSVNDYFNKTVNWQIKYFILLNKKM